MDRIVAGMPERERMPVLATPDSITRMECDLLALRAALDRQAEDLQRWEKWTVIAVLLACFAIGTVPAIVSAYLREAPPAEFLKEKP